MNLTTEKELAEAVLGLPEERVARMRRRHRWPHVRLGRFDVRYTDPQVEQIVSQHSVIPAKATPTPQSVRHAAGLTPRSASRKRKTA